MFKLSLMIRFVQVLNGFCIVPAGFCHPRQRSGHVRVLELGTCDGRDPPTKIIRLRVGSPENHVNEMM